MFGVGVATYVGGSGYICGWEWLMFGVGVATYECGSG